MGAPTKLRIGKRSQKTELSGRGPLRKRRSPLDCNDIEEEEEEEEDEEEEKTLKTCALNVPSEKKLNLHDHSYFNCLELHSFGKEKYDLFSPQITKMTYSKVVQFQSFRTKTTFVIFSDNVFVTMNLLFCSFTLSDDFDSCFVIVRKNFFFNFGYLPDFYVR